MSSVNSKKLIMLELDIIASVDWKPEFGKKLKLMRGKVSRRALAQKVIDQYDYKVSQQYIQLLEHPEGNEKAPATVSFKLLRHLTEALNTNVYDLFGSPEIFASDT